MSEPPLVIAFTDEALGTIGRVAETFFGTREESVLALTNLLRPVCQVLAAFVDHEGQVCLGIAKLALGDRDDPARCELTVKENDKERVVADVVFSAHHEFLLHTIFEPPSATGVRGWRILVAHVRHDEAAFADGPAIPLSQL